MNRLVPWEVATEGNSCNGPSHLLTPYITPLFVSGLSYARFNGAKSKMGTVKQGLSANKKTCILATTSQGFFPGFPGNSVAGQSYAPNPQTLFLTRFSAYAKSEIYVYMHKNSVSIIQTKQGTTFCVFCFQSPNSTRQTDRPDRPTNRQADRHLQKTYLRA